MLHWDIEPFLEASSSPHIGRWLLYLEETDSTNTLALNEPGLLEKDGLIVLAGIQRQGRGRRARVWASDIKGNLYFSCIIHNDKYKKSYGRSLIPDITLIAAIALYKAISEVISANEKNGDNTAKSHLIEIKWPNDLMINGKKVAGILTESRKDRIVLGIGVNLRGRYKDYPDEIRKRAISLEYLGYYLDTIDFLRIIIDYLNRQIGFYLDNPPQAVYNEWTNLSGSIGKAVRIKMLGAKAGEEANDGIGIVKGLSHRGALLVEEIEDGFNGKIREIISEDIEFI